MKDAKQLWANMKIVIKKLQKSLFSRFLVALVLFLFFLSPLSAWCEKEKDRLYYIRQDVLFSNFSISRSNLLMVPGEEEFRLEKFLPVTITVAPTPSSLGHKKDPKTNALHNALEILLEQQGLTSIKNRSTTFNGSSRQDTIMSYEGAVILPVKTLNQILDAETQLLNITMEIRFAPLSFPDKWKQQQFINKWKQTLKKGTDLFFE